MRAVRRSSPVWHLGWTVLLAMVLPLRTMAEPWSCVFTVECHAGLACDATEWEMEVIAADHEGQLFFSSIFDEVAATSLGSQAYAGPDRLLSIASDGTARFSTHSDAVITYFGICEVLE